jgi:hypothetical protein
VADISANPEFRISQSVAANVTVKTENNINTLMAFFDLIGVPDASITIR